MDLGITNIFIFYLRSWLILFIVISQPSFDHRMTLTFDLITPVWVDEYKRNREFGSIYSSKVPRYVPRFQELNKDFVLLHPFQESHHSVLYPTRTHPVFFLTGMSLESRSKLSPFLPTNKFNVIRFVPGAWRSPYYCAPHVCVLNFSGGLAVWLCCKQTNTQMSWQFCGS